MDNSTDREAPRLTPPLYAHVVAATATNCVVVIVALAARSMQPWAAAVLLVTALALGAHAAHVRRQAALSGGVQ